MLLAVIALVDAMVVVTAILDMLLGPPQQGLQTWETQIQSWSQPSLSLQGSPRQCPAHVQALYEDLGREMIVVWTRVGIARSVVDIGEKYGFAWSCFGV